MPKVTSDKFSSNSDMKLHDMLANFMFTETGFTKLRTFLGQVEKGQAKVYTAPFAKGQSMEEILSDWSKTLESIQREWPTLVEFENDLAKKVGPMSVMKPLRERIPDIAHYYEDILLPSKPIKQAAIDAVIGEFSSIRGLRLRNQQHTVELMKKSTNSGSPFWSKRRDVIQDTVPISDIGLLPGGPMPVVSLPIHPRDWMCTAVIGWRGQEGGPEDDDVKQRVVWMFPFAINILELQVYQPLIEKVQDFNLVPAWVSMDSVDDSITKLFDTKSSDDLIVCTDFSRFDQHFNRWMQLAAKSILRRILTTDQASSSWLDNVFPIKYLIPLAVETEETNGIGSVKVLSGYHGMGSGSGGTNADETLAHRALQYEVALTHHAELNPNSQCLGDDGILSYPGITVEDVVKTYESHGQECNPDKQYASTQDCVYLRRWHHKDYRIDGVCRGVYSTYRALGRLRYLERFMDPEYWSPEMVALRQLSIIENCKWHPLFHEFIEFCMKRDKFRLGIDIPGFLDNITQLAKEATDHMQDFLGYTKTLQGEGPQGIADWEVVKYLKSRR